MKAPLISSIVTRSQTHLLKQQSIIATPPKEPDQNLNNIDTISIKSFSSIKKTGHWSSSKKSKTTAKKGKSTKKGKRKDWGHKKVSINKKLVFISSNHRKLLNYEMSRLNNLSSEDLSYILKLNNQYSFGNKIELMIRVATGRIYGKVPYCPICKQNKLSLNFELGEYRCTSDVILPGTTRYCEAIFKFSEIETEVWQEDQDWKHGWAEVHI